MPRQTPYAQSGSLLSDRVPPRSTAQNVQAVSQGPRKKSDRPKSKTVQDLECLLSATRDESCSKIVDPKGGCFCQARSHSLSPYRPICMTCGLLLCILNPPNHACPHCTSSLLPSSLERTQIITQIENQLRDTLAREEAERIELEEEARRAVGQFPTLQTSMAQPDNRHLNNSSAGVAANPQEHKVLSLGSKKKRAILTTTTTRPSPPSSSTPSRPASPPVVRVGPPPGAIQFMKEYAGADRLKTSFPSK